MILPNALSLTERFPLEADEVTKVLDDIKEDPELALYDLEDAILSASNENLAFFINLTAEIIGESAVDAYLDGAMTTHKILREASLPYGSLPTLDWTEAQLLGKAVAIEIANNVVLNKTVPEEERVTMAGTILGALGGLLASETRLVIVLDTLTGYRSDRTGYYAGSATVVAGLVVASEGPSCFPGLGDLT